MAKKTQTSTIENFFVSEGHRALYNEITYLKKRIHLVEGERKANYESNEALIKKNDGIIKQIKEKSKTLRESRKGTVEKHNGYFKKIADAVGGEKKANEFRGKNFREVIDILEYKIGALRNKLNIVDYKRAHYASEMKEVLQMEGTLKKKLTKKNGHSDPRVEELKATETSTAAMQMKTTEAENVRARYKHMLRVLKDENYTQTINLREMENLIEKQEKEIVRIQTVVQDASKARKAAKAHLVQVEGETIQAFSKREQELYEARMKLKIIRDQMEAIGSKLSYPKFHIIHRDSSVTDGFTQDSSKLEPGEGSKSQSTVELVYNELLELTGESDPNLVVERFEKQRHHVKELVKEEQTMKSSVRKAKLRKRFLADKLGQLQYSGGLTREELDLKAEEINNEIEITTVERDHLDNLINEHTVMLEQMLAKLIEICQNNDLRVAPSATNGATLGQKVIAHLKHIFLKTEQIIQEQISSAPLLSPLSPMAVKRTSKTLGSGLEINKEEDERMLGIDSTPPPQRFGSTGDISSMTGQTDVSGMGSRRPSIADLSQLDTSGLTLDKLVADAGEPTIAGIGIGAVSPMSDSTTGFQLQLPVPEEDGRDDIEKSTKPRTFTSRGQESSEEEEAVTRNFVKRQSQILFEAKTRKGRFNPNSAPAARHRRY